MSISECALLIWTFCLYFCQCAASSWTVHIPSSVKALEGSCVVIPCSFDYPPPEEKVTQFTGIWMDESSHVIYHPDERKALVQYRNRTNLLGDLRRKDCSLKIDPVQSSDKGPYRFRIEMAEFNSYSYNENTVTITTTLDPEPVVFSVKEEVLLGDSVSAQCSVSHSCPHSPPHFSWSHSGHVQLQHQAMGGALWRTTSNITFQPSHTDHNRELHCTVMHRGGQQQRASKVLSVMYAPEIRNTSSCYLQGHHVRCMCVAEANPPSEVQLLLSDQALPNTRTEQYGLLTVATLQTDIGFFKSIKCSANNTVGKADLQLFLPLSNIYIYIGAGTGAAALILIILLIALLARKCSGRKRKSASSSHPRSHNLDLDTSKSAAATRKWSAEVHYPVSYISDHTYGNTETFNPDDAVYANV